MHVNRGRLSEVVGFVAITYLFTIALALVAKWAFPSTSVAIMLVPMTAAFAVQKFVSRRPLFRGGALGFRLGRKAYLLWAPLVLFGFGVLSLGATILVRPSALVSLGELTSRLDRLGILAGSSAPVRVAVVVAVDCVLGPLVNLPIFLGEEVGWRAFLVPRLESIFGRRASIVGGVIWAVWHVPMIWLFGLNYPQNPFVGLLVWIPLCVCLSILLQHLYRRSGSVFAVALAHGAMNKVAVLGLSLFVSHENLSPVVYGPAGLVGLALLLPLAIHLYRIQPRAFVLAEEQEGQRACGSNLDDAHAGS